MLFGNDDTYYWLASSFVSAGFASAIFGLRNVGYGDVDGGRLVGSDGVISGRPFGVRAVVTLKSNIKLEGTAASGYEIL